MRLIYFLLFASSGLLAQGSLGFQFGLNDDNFGSIENIGNKIDNYDLDIKNSTGFQFGFFTEIDCFRKKIISIEQSRDFIIVLI